MSNGVIKSLYISYNGITEPIVQSQVIPYLRGLSKKGIKFYLLTFEKKKIKKEGKNRIRDALKKQFEDRIDLEWFSLNYHKKPTGPATLFDIIIGWMYSSYIIIKNKIDIVHARAIVSALMGYPIAKMLSKKFIFDIRGISEEYVDAGLWKRDGFKHRIISFLEGVLIKSSEHIVVLTEKFSEILKNKYRDYRIKVSVVPCAVDIDRFKPREGNNAQIARTLGIEDKFVIVYSGSIGTWYMLREMIELVKAATKVIENIHFLILTQSNRVYVRNIIKQTGLDEKYVTITTVTHDSIPLYLSLCKISIFFIKPCYSKIASCPTKLGESLAAGLPVLTNYGIGDVEKIVESNNIGVVIKNFGKEEYLKAIRRMQEMLLDKDISNRCKKIARDYFSLDKAIDKYSRIYNIIS